MAPRSALANISYTVDSASEDEMARDDPNAFPTPDSNAENKAPTRKPRAKPAQAAKSKTATKAAGQGKATTRRASGASVLGVKKQNAAVTKKTGAKRGRKPLAEHNNANMSDTEEVDEFEADEVAAPVEPPKPVKRGRPTKAKKAQEDVSETQPPKKTRKAAEAAPAAKKVSKAKAAAKGKTTKRAPSPEPEPEEMIPETQPESDPMDVEESIEIDEIPESIPPPPPKPTARRMQQHRSSSKLPPSAQRRAGSASDSERDSALRRKLGDATKMLEALIVKYDNLKEVASSQKESNFEQLRRRSERTAKDRDAVIKALKQQMSEAHSSLAELDSLKKTLAKMDKDNDKMEAENKLLAAELHSIRSENKTLFTKLTAARSSAPPEGKQVPGSAVKARSAVILPGSAEAAKEALLRQLKIDLYSDLTNLVVCGIKRGEGEDVFDCLQTGRNGTLHFHLSVAQDSETFEDAEFVYSPQLNESRDRELLDLLPDYLTEEIVFPRAQVAKFYMKVVDSMSKKIEIEDE